MNNNTKNVLFLFGGKSCERDISVITGVLALNCTDKTKYNPVPVYVTEEGWFTGEQLFEPGFYKNKDVGVLKRVCLIPPYNSLYFLNGKKINKAFEVYCGVNCCHGLNGEDGTLAGIFRLCDIPFASPACMASSVFMDKAASKYYLQGMGLPVLPFFHVTGKSYFSSRELCCVLIEKKIGYPCIVKPANLGSSIGVTVAKERQGLKDSLEYALRYDSKVIIEKALVNFTEINCAAYKKNGKIVISQCESPKASGELLSFEDKYGSGLENTVYRGFSYIIEQSVAAEIRDITASIYRKAFLCGIVRVDFLVSQEGKVYVNEINTVPGSLALYLFKNNPAEYGELISELIEEGVSEEKEFRAHSFTYGSDVLSFSNLKKGAKRSTSR